MRAKAGDPPRSMPEKVFAARADDRELRSASVRVKVDQVVLAAQLEPTLSEAAQRNLKRVKVETAVAYETRCVTLPDDKPEQGRLPREAVRAGVWLARAGIGFPSAVHLERFAAPGRLALTDSSRLATLGAAGMLTLVASPAQLAEALTEGSLSLRRPRSVQVLLSGKLRPFSTVKDAALELLARGLDDVVRRIEKVTAAPVVVEFAGPSARLFSVPERAVLCSLAPSTGAAAAVFVSDERTEAFLRDQRRSKAHRLLVPDPGAPCDEVLSLDLDTVVPLVLDQSGRPRPVRELAGSPVRQAILGGDCGVSLRDLLSAAALLKSKRVPPGLDFLIAPPSHQALEVITRSGALAELVATGARVLEADGRLLTQELYSPLPGELSLRSFDPASTARAEQRALVASAETLAFAVATGALGDPRGFKRPARVVVPRELPTDDALIVRRERSLVGVR
jgi:aconitate hydratase